jgi:hypothetical protein
MLEEGDKYIHFTKRGSVNKGTVKRIGSVTEIDTGNQCHYERMYMVNEKNIHYDLDGRDGRFYKVSMEYSKEEADELKRAMDELAEIKNERRSKILTTKPKTKKIIDEIKNIDEALKRGFDDNYIS